MATATTPPTASGITMRSSQAGTTSTVANNMISLGTSRTTNTEFIGIWSNFNTSGNGFFIHHNSVVITGTVTSGALPTFGFLRGDNLLVGITTAITMRNNIFINERTGGTGKHYALGSQVTALPTTGWSAAGSNFNVLNTTTAATLGLSGTTDYNFANWKTNTTGDASSLNAVAITFVDQANGDLHLSMGVTPTVLESNGDITANTLITTDFDGHARPGPAGSVNGGAFAPDFGADEFDGVTIDVTAPVISYTSLPTTCALGNRTLTATITDFSGVPTAGAGLPVLYWRINAGAYTAATATHAGGNNYDFTFGTGVVSGNTVSYYIVAQDAAGTPNVGAFPSLGTSGFTASPPASTTPPTTPSSYGVGNSLNGIYTVGVAGAYTTLTSAVSAYNTGCLAGPVTFNLIDATYPSETYPITINHINDANITNFLTIKPNTTATISGSISSTLIALNGADYVTIDGSNNG
ncbi:MAG: hypothetical protein ACOVOV_00370, partial [Dolichospermum sp.]